MAEDSEGEPTWPDRDVRFGNPAEWQAFAERLPRFLDRWARLQAALVAAFTRSLENANRDEVVLFFLGYRCAEDFLEIMLLCGNGEGHAAQKLLRTMFEHVVTLKYLHQNRDQIDAYFNYRHVTMFKQAQAVRRFWGPTGITTEQIAGVTARYEAVKNNYKNKKCANCGHAEMAIAWSPVPLPDMADKVGLGQLVPAAYYEPLLEAHPSIAGIGRRIDIARFARDGHVVWGSRVDRPLADRVLLTAHLLLIGVLEVQRECFSLPDAHFDSLGDDWEHIWNAAPANAPPQVPSE
jgi:limonene-1,2-epoxide hydrolase